jgi:hypothetical protein
MSSNIEERMKVAKTTAKSFRFTPREWSMIEAEASRLNMSKAFFVQLAVTAAIGKFKPLPLAIPSFFEIKESGGA